MRLRGRWCSAFALTSLAFILASHAGAEPLEPTRDALRTYVHRPDPAYAWKVVKRVPGETASMSVVKLTSQSWRTSADVDRTVWEHWLVIQQPAKITSDTCFLLIGGGSNGGDPPDRSDAVATRIAAATGSLVVELKMVPNQPLVFHGDGVPRKEDDLIGYAWDQFLKTNDATWLPRLPMVKSVVRAMDCVQELMASEEGGRVSIKKFVIAGGSKRGWTTWMTGAADPRVAAIVPIVIDVVNVEPSMRHHAAVYGFWAESIGNYVQHGITQRWNDPRMDALYQVVDPYFQRDRLTMPKYIVNATGDQFFCPDSSQFYYADLQGEKLLRYVPNADHSLRDTDAAESIAAFYQLIASNKPRPRYDWTFEDDGEIRVSTPDQPRDVRLWQATNAEARDFRLMTIGPAFQGSPVAMSADGTYVGRVAPPSQGWTAYFIELTYDVGLPVPLKVTTAVRVVPDVLPHADLDPNQVPYEAAIKK